MTGSGAERALNGPTIRRHLLGAELRELREAGGHRLEDVAVQLGVAPSTLSRIETGKAPARTSYVTLMLDIYHVEDPQRRRRLADLAREGQRRGWWAGYDDLLPPGTGSFLGLESAAAKACTFAVQTVPGLLQTAGYAAAVSRAARPDLAAGQIEALVNATMARQELAWGRLELHAVIDESALLRTVGSAGIMAAQLDHLAAAMAEPLVTVQVLRLTAPAHVLCAGFTILSFPADGFTDVGSRDNDDHVTVTSDSGAVSRLRTMFASLARQADPAASSAALINELRKR